MEKVQVVPSPKDIDPRVLSWKGAAVLAKLEALNDMWITARDWVSFELFGLAVYLGIISVWNYGICAEIHGILL
jgi:hypothetical protein